MLFQPINEERKIEEIQGDHHDISPELEVHDFSNAEVEEHETEAGDKSTPSPNQGEEDKQFDDQSRCEDPASSPRVIKNQLFEIAWNLLDPGDRFSGRGTEVVMVHATCFSNLQPEVPRLVDPGTMGIDQFRDGGNDVSCGDRLFDEMRFRLSASERSSRLTCNFLPKRLRKATPTYQMVVTAKAM